MIEIDYKNRDPIYLQIVQSIMQLIMLGNLQEGDQLPAVRQLAVELASIPILSRKRTVNWSAKALFIRLPARAVLSKERNTLTLRFKQS